MGRFGANVIIFILNNSGYLIERALEENPNWTYNDLAPLELRRIAEGTRLRRLVHCARDHARRARRSNEVGPRQQIRGLHRNHGRKMDMPPALAFAHGQLKAMYGDTP